MSFRAQDVSRKSFEIKPALSPFLVQLVREKQQAGTPPVVDGPVTWEIILGLVSKVAKNGQVAAQDLINAYGKAWDLNDPKWGDGESRTSISSFNAVMAAQTIYEYYKNFVEPGVCRANGAKGAEDIEAAQEHEIVQWGEFEKQKAIDDGLIRLPPPKSESERLWI